MLGILKAMGITALTGSILLTGCASAPRLPNSQTASEQFSTLGYHDKFVARNFYDLGSGDAIKRLYFAQRNVQQYRPRDTVDGSPVTSLQRRYVVLPVPEHVDPDGTIKEANNQVVEVVQFMEGVRRK
jgi:hypothetical protein